MAREIPKSCGIFSRNTVLKVPGLTKWAVELLSTSTYICVHTKISIVGKEYRPTCQFTLVGLITSLPASFPNFLLLPKGITLSSHQVLEFSSLFWLPPCHFPNSTGECPLNLLTETNICLFYTVLNFLHAHLLRNPCTGTPTFQTPPSFSPLYSYHSYHFYYLRSFAIPILRVSHHFRAPHIK